MDVPTREKVLNATGGEMEGKLMLVATDQKVEDVDELQEVRNILCTEYMGHYGISGNIPIPHTPHIAVVRWNYFLDKWEKQDNNRYFCLSDKDDSSQACVASYEDFTDLILDRLRSILGEQQHLEVLVIDKDSTRVDVNGIETVVGYVILFPTAHINMIERRENP